MSLMAMLLSCQNGWQVRSLTVQTANLEIPQRAVSEALHIFFDVAYEDPQQDDKRVDYWMVTYSPGSPFNAPVTVTFYATYFGTGPAAGGNLCIEFRNAGSSCYGAEFSPLCASVPANPYNGQVVNLGTADLYNGCGDDKIIKFVVTDWEVGGTPVDITSINNTITP